MSQFQNYYHPMNNGYNPQLQNPYQQRMDFLQSYQQSLQQPVPLLNVFFDELDEIMKDASPEMRSMIKTKGMARMQKIQ